MMAALAGAEHASDLPLPCRLAQDWSPFRARVVRLAAAPVLLAVALAAASSNYQAPAARAQAQVAAFLAGKNDVARLVALYRFSEAANQSPDQQAVLPALEKMAAAAQNSPLLASEVDAEMARQKLKQGDAEGARTQWRRLGVVESWRALGPFDNSTPNAIAQELGPEKGIDLAASYAGKQAKVRWRRLPFPAAQGGYNLGLYFTPAKSASAYLVSWVRSAEARPVALRFSDGGATRVWLNGRKIFEETGSHRLSGFDMHAVGAWLAAGENEILVKAGATESNDWTFSLRVTTPSGEPLPLEASDTPPAAGVGQARAGTAPAPAVADLTAEARKGASTATGAWDYAWVLAKKGNFNQGDHDEANAFEAAVALDPNHAAVLLDYAEHDADESRRNRNLSRALALDPSSPEALADRGFVELSRREFWPARQDFEAALHDAARPEDAPQALLGLFATYAGFGLQPVARDYAKQLREAGYERAPGIAGVVAHTLETMGLGEAALPWARALRANDRGGLSGVLSLANLQRAHGDFQSAEATLAAAQALTPQVPLLEEVLARAEAGLGRRTEALAAIRRATSLDPQNPDFRATAGDLERQFGQRQAALADWQAALALNPQDSDLRDRLQLERGGGAALESSFEHPYTVDPSQAIAAYEKDPGRNVGGPVVVLVDSTVAQVFPSGNVGRYVQQIYKVNNVVGAQQLATYAVTYDPATEQVRYLAARVRHPDGSWADAPEAQDAPVSESVGYETFYDVRNKYVVMPAIQPGDYVEIAYRVMPTTLESLYGDYYGEIVPFQGAAAAVFQQFVVISPADKPLHTEAVRFTGQHALETRDGEKIYRWTLRDEPAFVAEPQSPPEIEQVPYVAVSSFGSWGQFANWYRGLVRDTFVLDDALRETTDGLIRGLSTPRQKVEAIYNYVIRNTHYVALEFGIHGYRPYPVAQVFHRRYGDCKDKASLLIAMLARAGVPADFVLVRTRDRGLVDPKIPSVADFDHAIVYVPSLHLYLDGTTEFNGMTELPDQDQRAFVLRVPMLLALDPDHGSAQEQPEPVVTPELPATENSIMRTVTGRLDEQGDLDFTAQWQALGGNLAPELRARLEIPERQAGALQAMLRRELPGISVYSASSPNDDAWNQAVKVTFQGEVPHFASVDAAGATGPLLIPREMAGRDWLPRMAPLAQRAAPVLLGPPQRMEETLRLKLPSGYKVALPAPYRAQAEFARASSTARLDGDVLTIETTVELLRSTIPISQYAAFRAFWASLDRALDQPLRAQP